MSIFFTADHHFGHAKIAEYCDRPFASAEEMDQALIDAWNAVVGPEDVVYHLGDFTLAESLSPWVHALKFKMLHVIPGGHDRRWLKKFCPASYGYRVEVLPPLVTLRFPQVVVLCHYPMAASHWDRAYYESIHLFGHTHGRFSPGGKSLDVGVDNACKLFGKFRPISLSEVLDVLSRSQ